MDKNNKILNNQYQQIDQNQSQQQEHSKKNTFMSLLAWFGAHKGVTTTIAVTAFVGITLGALGGADVFTLKGGGDNPEPDPNQYREITKVEAESWFDSHYVSALPNKVDATSSFDFSDTSSGDWEASKSGFSSLNVFLWTGFNGDSSWNWSDAETSKTSSKDVTNFQSFSGANMNWSAFDQIYGSSNCENMKYYLNEDSSIFKFNGNENSYPPSIKITRITEVYFSSNNCALIEFRNIFESASYSTYFKNLNGIVSFKVTKNY